MILEYNPDAILAGICVVPLGAQTTEVKLKTGPILSHCKITSSEGKMDFCSEHDEESRAFDGFSVGLACIVTISFQVTSHEHVI